MKSSCEGFKRTMEDMESSLALFETVQSNYSWNNALLSHDSLARSPCIKINNKNDTV